MDDIEQEDGALERLAQDVIQRLQTGAAGPSVRYVGDYEIEEEIARGGMGVVFRARQKSLGRTVALKMILAGRFASAEEVARFRIEAEAAAGLSHPGIVGIYEIGIHEGHHYFSMEFVEGRSLERIGNGAPIASMRAAEYARGIAEAVQYAHEQGVLHRDLKPSNVLLDERDRVRITDFGLAKRSADSHDLTDVGQILGTPAYMAPEQAAGQGASPASDVYSIGAILYELITGRAPFAGETPLATLMQLRDSDPLPPSLLNPRIPRDLATICLTALEKSADKRYASAAALATDLKRFLDGKAIRARPAGRTRRLLLWAERNPWIITAALMLGMILLGCFAYGLYAETQQLRWLVANPESTRTLESGTFTAPWREWWAWVYLFMLWIPADLRRRSSGLTLRQFRDRRIPKVLGLHSISRWRLAFYGAVLVLALLYAAVLVKLRIDEFVLAGRQDLPLFGFVLDLAVIWVAALCLVHVGREVRATLHGVPPRQYSAEEAQGHVDELAILISIHLNAGKLEEAEELCDLLRSMYPERPEWMELRADLLAQKGEGAQAARLYRDAAAQAERVGGYVDAYIEGLEERERALGPVA